MRAAIPLNMNVLSKGKVPKVMDLAEVLKEYGSIIAATS